MMNEFPISFDIMCDGRIVSKHSVRNIIEEQAIIHVLLRLYRGITQINRIER